MTTVAIPEAVAARTRECPRRLLFATVSGAHLYGFESADSDWDLRGAFVAPTRDVLSLRPISETFEVMDKESRPEFDLVVHEVKKYFGMLLKGNGYVLEQVYSPIIACALPEFEELKQICRLVISKQSMHHFFHFGVDQWKLACSKDRPTVKGLLYTYRPLVAGIHLMRTGEVQSNLRRLNELHRLPQVDDLIARKLAGQERQEMSDAELLQHRPLVERLCAELQAAREQSHLPDQPGGHAELNDLLLRLRGCG